MFAMGNRVHWWDMHGMIKSSAAGFISVLLLIHSSLHKKGREPHYWNLFLTSFLQVCKFLSVLDERNVGSLAVLINSLCASPTQIYVMLVIKLRIYYMNPEKVHLIKILYGNLQCFPSHSSISIEYFLCIKSQNHRRLFCCVKKSQFSCSKQ